MRLGREGRYVSVCFLVPAWLGILIVIPVVLTVIFGAWMGLAGFLVLAAVPARAARPVPQRSERAGCRIS